MASTLKTVALFGKKAAAAPAKKASKAAAPKKASGTTSTGNKWFGNASGSIDLDKW